MKNILLSIVLVLSACSLAQPLDQAVTTAEQLIQYYDNGEIRTLVLNATLTEEQIKNVQNSLRTADRIRTKFEEYRDNPRSIPNLRIVEIEYGRLKNAYLEVRQIVLENQEEYDQYTWDTFEIFDIVATELDASFEELLESARMNEAVVNTISLANSIIRIAALL